MDTSKHLPRDVFLYLLVFVTLCIVSVNVGTLLFQFVNLYVPDIVADPYMPVAAYNNAIRWSVAMLVIVFPVFVWAMRFLKRDIAANQEKRDLKIRRWILYLALFAAGAVLIGDLVALVYGFLQGELTARFILKAVSILAIAGAVFTYFLNELRERAKPYRIFSWSVLVLIAASIVIGIAVAGLPQSQRLVRLDERRSSDLSAIHNQILEYWRAKTRLPKNMTEIQSADIFGSWEAPKDPLTNDPYEYRVLGEKKFELCAVFQTDATTSAARYTGETVPAPVGGVSGGDFTKHGVGRTCFERQIDPDFLKKQ